MPTPLTLVFQGLIAFAPGITGTAPDLTAYVIDASQQPVYKCAMTHTAKIRFVTNTCNNGCTTRLKDPTMGPMIDACECSLSTDLISVGGTVPDLSAKAIAHAPQDAMPQSDTESLDPAYVVDMNNLGATLDATKVYPTKLAATFNFSYDVLESHNFAIVGRYAEDMRFKQEGTMGLTSHVQAAATTLVARITTMNPVLTLVNVVSGNVRTFPLTPLCPTQQGGTQPCEILIQNEPSMDVPAGCDASIGYDFTLFYQLAKGTMNALELNLPQGMDIGKMPGCTSPFRAFQSQLETFPFYQTICDGTATVKTTKTVTTTTTIGGVTTATTKETVIPTAVTTRSICAMALFSQ